MIEHTFSRTFSFLEEISSFLSIDTFINISLKPHETFSIPETNQIGLLCVEQGAFLLSSPTNDLSYSSHQAILLPFDCPYEIQALETLSFFYITFSGSFSDHLLETAIQKGNFYHISTFTKIREQLSILCSLLSHPTPNQTELSIAIFSLLMYLSSTTKEEHTPLYPPLISSAIAIMEEEYTYLYGIEELADKLETSKHHFIRLFTKSVGYSPLKYLTSVKLKKAKEQLANTNLPLELVAVSCGFSSGNYFSKVFKKEFGLSPTQYREQCPNKPSTPHILDELYL